jgi:hypothetical protein
VAGVIPRHPQRIPRSEFLLVRPDQHIAWQAEDPAGLDIETAAELHLERDPVRAGI